MATRDWTRRVNDWRDKARERTRLMSKRTPAKPRPFNHFDTPIEAIEPLLSLLEDEGMVFGEPCLGSGNVAQVLKQGGFICGYTGDIQTGQDVLQWTNQEKVDFAATNPPWDRRRILTNQIIDHLLSLGIPSWLLLPGDWIFNQSSAPWLPFVSDVLSVGRVRWITGTHQSGFENAAWMRFTREPHDGAKLHAQRKRTKCSTSMSISKRRAAST
jgi:hypothetical protein